MAKQRFLALDSFRGLCALCVVVHHMNLSGSITELNFFRNSFFFVEFFFVLSGFVLAHGYGSVKNLTFPTYIKARFFRLFPLHIFMLMIFLLLELGKLAAFKAAGFEFNNVPFTGSSSLSEIMPNMLLVQSWIPQADPYSFNYPSWSISVEFYMYIMLFVTIVYCRSYRVALWVAMSFVAFTLIAADQMEMNSLVIRGISCFFAGSALYSFYRYVSHVKLNVAIGTILEVVLLFTVVWVVQSDLEKLQIVAPLVFIATVFLFAFEFGLVSNFLKGSFLQLLGKLSYSIYMVHAAFLFCVISLALIVQKWTGINLAPMVETTRYLNFGSEFLNNLAVILVVSLIVMVSYFTYKFVEMPGQRLGKA